MEEAPAAEQAGKNCQISVLDHALAAESPDVAKVPTHGNSAPSTDNQAPAGEEDFGHRAIVAVQQVPEAGQSSTPIIQQVS